MPKLVRYQIFIGYGATFLAIWIDALKYVEEDAPVRSLLIRWAPLWAVLLLGIYALGSVLHGVVQTRDVPEAAEELEAEIAEARAEMKRKGIMKQ